MKTTLEKRGALALRRLRMMLRAEHGPEEADRIMGRVLNTLDALATARPGVVVADIERTALLRALGEPVPTTEVAQ